MAKKTTFFLWGAGETACWFLVAMYPPAVYTLTTVPLALGIISSIALFFVIIYSVIEHWDDGKKG